jgi:hypothetical protein
VIVRPDDVIAVAARIPVTSGYLASLFLCQLPVTAGRRLGQAAEGVRETRSVRDH